MNHGRLRARLLLFVLGSGLLSLSFGCVETPDPNNGTTASTTTETTSTNTSTTSTTDPTTTTTMGSTTTTTTMIEDPRPTVVSVTPEPGDTGVSTTPTITVTFSEPMDANTISTNENSTACSGTLQVSRTNFSQCLRMKYAPVPSGDGTQFEIEPMGILAGNMSYTVRVTSSATADNGQKMLTTYTMPSGFQTQDDDGQGTYYENINTMLNGDAFADELHKLIDDHDRLRYNEVWDAFIDIDSGIEGCNNNQIFDLYANKCWTASVDQCGNSNCYNREHGWPKSWFNCSVSSSSKGNEAGCTDLHHIYPSDAGANASKGNLGLGEVVADQYVGDNARTGTCSSAGSPSKCWEPADEFKGDFARAFMYFSVRYRQELLCCDTDEVNEHQIDSWMEDVLRSWHAVDAVSPKERNRNTGIEGYQGNRNPFVDHPSFADKISNF